MCSSRFVHPASSDLLSISRLSAYQRWSDPCCTFAFTCRAREIGHGIAPCHICILCNTCSYDSCAAWDWFCRESAHCKTMIGNPSCLFVAATTSGLRLCSMRSARQINGHAACTIYAASSDTPCRLNDMLAHQLMDESPTCQLRISISVPASQR